MLHAILTLKDRAHLHVPPDLARLVREHGRPGLLADSTAVLGRLRQSTDPAVRAVVQILDETGCGLEQEALLLRKTHFEPPDASKASEPFTASS